MAYVPMPEVQVEFICKKVGGKLRINITSPGYHPTANCQFPKAIRIEGVRYTAPISAVSFAEGPRKTLFYRVKKNDIKIISDPVTNSDAVPTVPLRIYDVDTMNNDCAICMDNEKSIVFIPCGHYCSCMSCAITLQSTSSCPICRASITSIIDHSRL